MFPRLAPRQRTEMRSRIEDGYRTCGDGTTRTIEKDKGVVARPMVGADGEAPHAEIWLFDIRPWELRGCRLEEVGGVGAVGGVCCKIWYGLGK